MGHIKEKDNVHEGAKISDRQCLDWTLSPYLKSALAPRAIGVDDGASA